ncbi:Phytoene [Hortaea werneckii]|nr:Phytoene [Hortaea werneckii]KAI7069860.1 Phytoene [Hortaea werneckii]KAI7224109.1 Phytoene [Hortaea werneckii]KAI7300279.1 Phytoene [Hortaea werneckii]KAI7391993.1 Phytoene [Hortaea werneckii]
MPSPKPSRPTALVIGAGVGGTSTAARLAHAGYAVTVLEKNPFTGGRCSLLYSPDNQYRFDQGPSLLLLPRLFHQTFAELDTSLAAEGVELRKCDPNYRIHFGDGEKFEMSSDLAAMKSEIEKWEGTAGFERYLDFLRESGRHYELSVEHVLLKNFESLAGMFRASFLRHLLTLHPFESIWTRAGKFFWTERLRRVFTFGSMYMGMSPFDAPGTYSLLQYTELAEGIWYPVGGFHRVVQALVEVGERKGVRYRLGTAVKRIVLSEDGGKVVGVETEKGEVLQADVVVNNSDLVYAYTNLLGEGSSREGKGGMASIASQPAPSTPYAKSLANRPASCSSISFYWGLSRTVPELGAHNIFLADEYRESFDSIFKRHLIPDEPSFYVNVPSRVDASAAPQGTDSVVVLVPVGHLIDVPSGESDTGTPHQNNTPPNPVQTNGDIKHASPTSQPGLQPSPNSQDWPAMIALARRTILATIQQRTGVDLAPLIVHESTNDPLSWKRKFNLDRGAILGLSHSFFNVLSFRPSTRARRPSPTLDGHFGAGVLGRLLELVGDLVRARKAKIEGLYMVGASAHPGTGVPICLAGGRIVAEQVLDDRGCEVPWRRVKGKGEQREEGLDAVDRPWWLDSWGQWMGIWGLVVVVLWSWVLFGVVW